MAGTVVLPAAAASASSALPSGGIVISAFSDPGEFVGGGGVQEFDRTNASFSGTVSTSGIDLAVSGGVSGQSWSFVLDPPPGQTFHVGYYPKSQRAEFRTTGYAGIDITGNSNGCNTDSGAIEIRDLATSGSTITRLNLLYEQHCEGLIPALFGQIRIGEPGTTGVIVSSSSITWPSDPGLPGGSHGTTVPVYLRNSGKTSVSIGTAAKSGLAAGDFAVVSNGCSGTVLASGGSCALYLRFRAGQRGARTAVLSLPVGKGSAQIELDALVRPGTTSLVMQSQPGDFVGAGQNYSFTGSSASFRFLASPTGLEQDLNATDGQTWTVDMYPAQGQILAPGSFPKATRYPFNGTGNGLSVYGDGRGCNTVTGSFAVKQAVFSAVDNSLQNFDGTFVQHCEGQTPALTGEVRYDAEPVTTPAPSVTKLKAVAAAPKLTITWANPTGSRYAYTLVRIYSSGTPAGVSPIAGRAVYAGTGAATTVYGLTSGLWYTVVVYTVDPYGNMSNAARYVIKYL